MKLFLPLAPHSKTDQRGFLTVGLLALIPLVLSLLAVFSAGTLILKNHSDSVQQCRVSLLQDQTRAGQILNQLTSLNPQASELRFELQTAEELALDPVTEPAAAVMMAEVRIRQAILAAQQKTLLIAGKTVSRLSPVLTATRLDARLLRASGLQQGNQLSLFRTRQHLRTGTFDVVASPAGSLTPDYNPSPRFSENQQTSVDVDVPIGALLPDWLRQILKSSDLTLHVGCSATLTPSTNTPGLSVPSMKGNQKWIPILNADRS